MTTVTGAATAETTAAVDALSLSPDSKLFPASPFLATTIDLLKTTLCALVSHRADLQFDLAVVESGFNAALAGNLRDQLRTQDFAVTLLRATPTIRGGLNIRLVLRYLILLREFQGSNQDHFKRIKIQVYMLNNVMGTISRGPVSTKAITVALDGELDNVKLLFQHIYTEENEDSAEGHADVSALLMAWTKGNMLEFSRKRLRLEASEIFELLVSDNKNLNVAYVEPTLVGADSSETYTAYAQSMDNLLKSLEWKGPKFHAKGTDLLDEWTYDGWSTAFAETLSYQAPPSSGC